MVIKKEGSYWKLYSKSTHKLLGKSKIKEGIEKRERQVQFFKNQKGGTT